VLLFVWTDNFRVRAWIIDGIVNFQNDMGFTSLRSIFVRKPLDVRWAVLESNGKFLCVDMYDLQRNEKFEMFLGNSTPYDDLDAAIMAAILKDSTTQP